MFHGNYFFKILFCKLLQKKNKNPSIYRYYTIHVYYLKMSDLIHEYLGTVTALMPVVCQIWCTKIFNTSIIIHYDRFLNHLNPEILDSVTNHHHKSAGFQFGHCVMSFRENSRNIARSFPSLREITLFFSRLDGKVRAIFRLLRKKPNPPSI